MIKFKKCYEDSQIPKTSHEDDAGFDLYARGFSKTGAKNGGVWINPVHVLTPGETVRVYTGIAVSVGKNKTGIIKPRSGLADNYAIDVLAGVIDAGYTDELQVILINHGKKALELKKGDRVAQLCVFMKFTECETVERLDETDRNSSAFGSTGK